MIRNNKRRIISVYAVITAPIKTVLGWECSKKAVRLLDF
jgi:hypothetical protein